MRLQNRHPVTIVRQVISQTQEQFAASLGVSREHVAKIETFRLPVSDDFARRIACYCGAQVDPGRADRENPPEPMAIQLPSTPENSADEPEPYERRHWRDWKRSVCQKIIDEMLEDLAAWTGFVLNAAGRAKKAMAVRHALGQKLDEVVREFKLEPQVLKLLENYIWLHGAKWDGSTFPDGKAFLVDPRERKMEGSFSPEEARSKKTQVMLLVPTLSSAPFWIPSFSADWLREGLSAQPMTMDLPTKPAP